ncbi:hypothetical protein BCR32DRAFT_278181 [Anaeromyces robustus]|uniref:Uncharacterized protein n=1 Tax=Anaeromyces robustus TaxID=1754192 RepID=A0A1Y1XD46_9FUNG|nr:hypothetical protein BCR32DRAFT_278181 [Anaeromyces robustus]|eukprot:ORX83294.1 hypothetical protein BCR32DRAFT_278181 [Anaeromyces robustus]
MENSSNGKIKLSKNCKIVKRIYCGLTEKHCSTGSHTKSGNCSTSNSTTTTTTTRTTTKDNN